MRAKKGRAGRNLTSEERICACRFVVSNSPTRVSPCTPHVLKANNMVPGLLVRAVNVLSKCSCAPFQHSLCHYSFIVYWVPIHIYIENSKEGRNPGAPATYPSRSFLCFFGEPHLGRSYLDSMKGHSSPRISHVVKTLTRLPHIPDPRSPISHNPNLSRSSARHCKQPRSTTPLDAAMATKEYADASVAALATTIPSLGQDEFVERLTWLLQLQGDTIDSFEDKLRARGLTLRTLDLGLELKPSIPPSSSHSSPTSSPTFPPISFTKSSPGQASTSAEIEDSNLTTDNMKPDVLWQQPDPTVNADAALVALTNGLTLGQEAAKDMEFCPWRMIKYYPDWFIGKANTPRVSPSSLAYRGSNANFNRRVHFSTSTGSTKSGICEASMHPGLMKANLC